MSISHWGLFPIVRCTFTDAWQVWELNDWIDQQLRHEDWLRSAYAHNQQFPRKEG